LPPASEAEKERRCHDGHPTIVTPYRDSEVHLVCAACDAKAGNACSRCGLPCCDAHQRETGRCRSCDATIQAAGDEVRIFQRPMLGPAVAYPLGYIGVIAAALVPELGVLAAVAAGAAFAGLGAAFTFDHWRLRRRIARALERAQTRELPAGS
jgi:hypothetical protein